MEIFEKPYLVEQKLLVTKDSLNFSLYGYSARYILIFAYFYELFPDNFIIASTILKFIYAFSTHFNLVDISFHDLVQSIIVNRNDTHFINIEIVIKNEMQNK